MSVAGGVLLRVPTSLQRAVCRFVRQFSLRHRRHLAPSSRIARRRVSANVNVRGVSVCHG